MVKSVVIGNVPHSIKFMYAPGSSSAAVDGHAWIISVVDKVTAAVAMIS